MLKKNSCISKRSFDFCRLFTVSDVYDKGNFNNLIPKVNSNTIQEYNITFSNQLETLQSSKLKKYRKSMKKYSSLTNNWTSMKKSFFL